MFDNIIQSEGKYSHLKCKDKLDVVILKSDVKFVLKKKNSYISVIIKNKIIK